MRTIRTAVIIDAVVDVLRRCRRWQWWCFVGQTIERNLLYCFILQIAIVWHAALVRTIRARDMLKINVRCCRITISIVR